MRNNLLQRAEKICLLESETGNLAGAEKVLRELTLQAPTGAECKRLGPTSEGAGHDLMITLRGSGKGGALLLGHYDTVPRAEGQKLWNRQDDKILGLGAYDMKGGLAIILELLEQWSHKPEEFEVIHALILGDEEWRLKPPIYRFSPWYNCQALLCFEGGEPDFKHSLVHGRFGASVVKTIISCDPIRAEHPLAGPSTVDATALAIQKMQEITLEGMPSLQITPTQLSAESAVNVVPGQSIITSVARFRDQVLLDEALNSLTAALPEFSIEHDIDHRFPALTPTSQGEATIELIKKEFPELHVVHRTGSSDVCWFAKGFPTIFDGLGPCGGGEHSRHEWVDAVSFEHQYQLANSILSVLFKSSRCNF